MINLKQLYIKQKVFSLSGKFTVKDESEKDVYYVAGSLLKIPKTFSITNANKEQVALVKKKTISLLPKFFVEVEGKETLTIKKEFSFFKSRYNIEGADIQVEGNWWDMDFKVSRHGKTVGQVSKVWLSWGDTYKVEIVDEELETIIIALVVAIDCVKADEEASSSVDGI